MGYKSSLSSAKIEEALLDSQRTSKQEYNVTQATGSNYSSFNLAVTAISDERYKVKGLVMTYYTGTKWVSKRYNGTGSSGFTMEENWVDLASSIGDAPSDPGSYYARKDGNWAKIVGADDILTKTTASQTYVSTASMPTKVSQLENDANYVTKSANNLDNYYKKSDTDNFLKKKADAVVKETGSSGSVTATIKPNKYYVFSNISDLNITLGVGASDVVNEYMFKFNTASSQATLDIAPHVAWVGGKEPMLQSGKNYQVSIVDQLAVIAEF